MSITDSVDEFRKLIEDANAECSDDNLALLIKAEREMVENRECLELLNERDVISREEFIEKLNLCFELFIGKASEILGDKTCKAIFDFGVGDKIKLVH